MNTLAVFGASGKSGLPLVRKALEQGFNIKALVRDPSKLQIKHSSLEIIQGDILDYNKVEETMQGTAAIISVIGRTAGAPEDVQSRGTKNIIKAMKKLNLKRLISLTGGGVLHSKDTPKFIDKAIVFIMKNLAGKESRYALEDGIRHAEIIRSSGLDWTIVRGPRLTESPATGKYKVGYVGHDSGIKLSREDLADFILKELKDGMYINDMPFVTNKD